MKVLYNYAISKGTITFEENTLDDYDYYEFIFGLNGVGTGKGRIFSKIVSKEFLKQGIASGDFLYIDVIGGENAIACIKISNVSDNSITFEAYAGGSSWSVYTVYIFKIIGRNM